MYDDELTELLDEYNHHFIKPTPCMGMNKMNCEQILRSNLFDDYSSIVKPTEDLLLFDTTFVEIDLVLGNGTLLVYQ